MDTENFWTAVAERSGDTAFCADSGCRKRRGAALPAALQKLWLRRKPGVLLREARGENRDNGAKRAPADAAKKLAVLQPV